MLTTMNTSIWCCVWGDNCQCASGTFGEPSGLAFLPLLTPCDHWGKDHHYLFPAEVFPGVPAVAPKACGHLKNFRAAVNGPENACKQFGKPASGTFPRAELFWYPPACAGHSGRSAWGSQQGVRKEELGVKGLQVLPWRDQLVKLIFLMK